MSILPVTYVKPLSPATIAYLRRSHEVSIALGDVDKVQVSGGGIVAGRDRMKAMYRDTVRSQKGESVTLSDADLKDSSGQPVVNGQHLSWCGVWAVDAWRRSGLDVKWIVGKGPCMSDGTALPKIPTNTLDSFAGVKAGDIITVETVRRSWPGVPVPPGLAASIPMNANHHAIVKSVVYAENGDIAGFNVIEGNNPDRLAQGSQNLSAIHENFISVTPVSRGQDKVGNDYVKRITGYIRPPA